MKKIGLISNNKNLKAIRIAKQIYDYLIEKKIDVFLLANDTMPSKFNLPAVSILELSKNIDALISVGGDGTFLRASRYCFENEIPIMGINVGKLGFLAEINIKDFKIAIDNLIEGNYKIDERMLLELSIIRNGNIITFSKNPIVALNEFVISRIIDGKILDFEIIVNNFNFYEFRSDGIIISTPTGSTAYSLSAGGPIVEPTNQAIIITPLSAHSLFSRSIIISPKNNIKIALKTKNKDDFLSSDGIRVNIELKKGDLLEFKKSRLNLKLITFDDNIFFKVFKEKLFK